MSHALQDLASLDEKFRARMDIFEIRMAALETRIGAKVAACEANVKLELAKIREELVEMRGDLKFNRWMSGITLAMVFAMFAKIFSP